jgi:hypothetical protein
MEPKRENALERFIGKTRALFAQEPDLDKRWLALRPILAELLTDPQVREASKSWPVPSGLPSPGERRGGNLLFYEDPDYGFVVKGLFMKKDGGRSSRDMPMITDASIRPMACWLGMNELSCTSESTIAPSRIMPKSRRPPTISLPPATFIWPGRAIFMSKSMSASVLPQSSSAARAMAYRPICTVATIWRTTSIMKASAHAKFRPRCCPGRDRNNQYRCSAIGATNEKETQSCQTGLSLLALLQRTADIGWMAIEKMGDLRSEDSSPTPPGA